MIDYALSLFFVLGSITCILFARNRQYYERTVEAHGSKSAKKTFRLIRIGGYIMFVIGSCMLILTLITS